MRQTRKQRRQKRSYKRLIILGLVLLLAFSVAACRYLNVGIGTAGERSDLMPVHNKINIMIMGVDRRNDDVGRSDTLMVATVDPDQKKASLLSLPRDTRVKIEGNGVDKINAAYAYGGHKLSQKTVEQLLGAPINYYVLIDIKSFERIIDALGGIDINVD
ncbi:MAG: LCP family protein, partial [Selenomonadaceae bacterium]